MVLCLVGCKIIFSLLVELVHIMIQNLSKRALMRQTVSTSTTELGRLFQILTMWAENEYFRVP